MPMKITELFGDLSDEAKAVLQSKPDDVGLRWCRLSVLKELRGRDLADKVGLILLGSGQHVPIRFTAKGESVAEHFRHEKTSDEEKTDAT